METFLSAVMAGLPGHPDCHDTAPSQIAAALFVEFGVAGTSVSAISIGDSENADGRLESSPAAGAQRWKCPHVFCELNALPAYAALS
jgi:hypothetical protein